MMECNYVLFIARFKKKYKNVELLSVKMQCEMRFLKCHNSVSLPHYHINIYDHKKTHDKNENQFALTVNHSPLTELLVLTYKFHQCKHTQPKWICYREWIRHRLRQKIWHRLIHWLIWLYLFLLLNSYKLLRQLWMDTQC